MLCHTQAHIDLSELALEKDSVKPFWLNLHGEKRGKQVSGLGEVRVAVWTSQSDSMDSDRIGTPPTCSTHTYIPQTTKTGIGLQGGMNHSIFKLTA